MRSRLDTGILSGIILVMRLNAGGFWRVLIVVYCLGAAAGIALGVSIVHDILACRASWTLEQNKFDVQSGHVGGDRTFDPNKYLQEKRLTDGAKQFDWQSAPVVAEACTPIYEPILAIALGLIAGFVVLFGGGLVVRWMYRGFTQTGA